jgi:hypothetical protein
MRRCFVSVGSLMLMILNRKQSLCYTPRGASKYEADT